jgi:hypothetical protein
MDLNSLSLINKGMLNDFFHYLDFQLVVLCFKKNVPDETMGFACLFFIQLPPKMDYALTHNHQIIQKI